jgi:hypothetical protein
MPTRYGIKEVANVALYPLSGSADNMNAPALYFDTLKVSNIENTADTSYATGGRGNPRILSWDYGRAGKVTLTDALISMPVLATLSGVSVTNMAGGTVYRSYKSNPNIHINTSTNTVQRLPTNGSTTWINVPLVNSSSVWVKKLGTEASYTNIPAASDASSGQLTPANVTSSTILTTTVIGEIHFSEVKQVANSVTINAGSFPSTFKLVGEMVMRDETTGTDYTAVFIIPKAKVESNFSLTMQPDGDPSTIDIPLEILDDGTNPMYQIFRLT